MCMGVFGIVLYVEILVCGLVTVGTADNRKDAHRREDD